MKKSYHSKKIVKQLKKEYKDDLEKNIDVVPEKSRRLDGILFCSLYLICCLNHDWGRHIEGTADTCLPI